jgi:hypothetical protein
MGMNQRAISVVVVVCILNSLQGNKYSTYISTQFVSSYDKS